MSYIENEKQPIIRRFARKILQIIKGYLIFIGLCVTLLLSAGLFFSNAPQKKVKIKPDSLLEFDLKGRLTYTPPNIESTLLEEFFSGEKSYYVPTVVRTLKELSHDQNTKAVILKLEDLRADKVALNELRAAIEHLRGNGKTVYAHAPYLSSDSYHLLSAANELTLTPSGSLSIPGPAFQLTYFGRGIKKLGVNLQVVKAGEYKSAFESFIANQPSGPAKKMYQSMEGSLRDSLVTQISDSRKQSKEKVRTWLETSFYTAEEALNEGIIDGIAFHSELVNSIGEKHGIKNKVSFSEYQNSIKLPDIADKSPGVGFILARGEIRFDSLESAENEISPNRIIEQLEWAAKTDHVKSVVLRIDSPGGVAIAADMIWSKVAELAKAKPVVASFGSVAASGGYYIAAPATHIIADPYTLTGSIGVIGLIADFSEFDRKYGVSFYTETQSKRTNLLNPGSRPTKEDLRLVQNGIADMYQRFLTRVSAGRNRSTDEIDKLAKGRVYTGSEALSVGLIDSLGSLGDAFTKAKVLAKMDPEKLVRVYRFEPEPKSLSDCLKSENFIDCVRHFKNASIKSLMGVSSAESAALRIEKEVLYRLRHLVGKDGNPVALALWTEQLFHSISR